MPSNNRGTRINKVIKVVKKHFKPVEQQKNLSVLEHLLFACCLENSLFEDASKAFDTLNHDYFDWNEVRVTSIRELAEMMKPLNDPVQSATRLKRVLQSVFESHYSFDLESMRKQNIGQTVKHLGKFNGMSPFILAYITQNALAGHAIPVNEGLLQAMLSVGVISPAEAAKKAVPGLERAIPKTKGFEVGSLLHQLGVELHRSPYGPTIRKLLLEIDPGCKDNLPKRPSKKEPQPEPAASKKAATKKTPAKSEEKTKPTKKAAATSSSKKGKKAPKKTAKPKKKTTKKKVVKKKVVKKKVAKKKPVKKKAAGSAKRKKKTSTKRLAKRKPR